MNWSCPYMYLVIDHFADDCSNANAIHMILKYTDKTVSEIKRYKNSLSIMCYYINHKYVCYHKACIKMLYELVGAIPKANRPINYNN